MTEAEEQRIVDAVFNAIKASSQDVGELPTVTSLDGVTSLPSVKGATCVLVPISLLAQPATDAAAVANAAAGNANAAKDAANDAATAANTAAGNADTAKDAANTAAEAANAAAENANEAAASAIRKITVKDKDGETLEELTPDEEGNADLTMNGGGSGSGFYNVTHEIPLESGFYTKETAVAALADADIADGDKPGMIITFELSAGQWIDYRFEGTDVSTFATPAAWNRYGGGDAIKKITVTTGTSTTELTPNENGEVSMEIPEVTIDETLDENSTNPVMNKAIAAAIAGLNANFGASLVLNVIGEGDDVAYSLSLLDPNGNVLSTTETFTGGGGGGIAVGTKVVLTRVTQNPTVKFGDRVWLQYIYDQINTGDSSSTGNGAHAVITIVRGATSYTLEQDIAAGSTNTIDVTKYLGVGNNTVRIRVTTNDEAAQVASVAWTVKTVQLTLASSFNIAMNINRGDTVNVPFALTGSGNKTLRMYVDGVDTEDRSINTSSANGSFAVNTTALAHGSHSVQLVAELELEDETIILSNSIYFDIAVRGVGNNTPVFATRYDYPDGRIIAQGARPMLLVSQYDQYKLIYAAYNPTETPTQVDIYEQDTLLSSSQVAFVRTEYTGRAMTFGTISCRLVCGGTTYTYSMVVAESELAIDEPVDGMTLKLSATGRSNSDVNRGEWTYGDITTDLTGFKWGGDGWLDGALRLTDDARAAVQFRPLATPAENATGAMAFMIRFRVTNIMDEAAEIIKCMDAAGTGFVITTQEARMVSRGNSTVTTKFASGEVYNIGFVAYPPATDTSTDDEKLNDNMLYLYVNGIMSGGVQRGASDSIYQATPQVIEMGSDDCTLDIYSIRSYSTYLTDSQMLDAFMIDLGSADDLLEKYNENAILDDNGQVSPETVRIPYIIITGHQENGVPTVLQAAVNNDKDPKYDVDEMLFVNPADPSRNFRCVGGCIRLQGTSSMAYPTKNYRVYFKNASKVAGDLYLGVDSQGVGGTLQAEAKYSLRAASATQKQSAPVDCFCFKADFAESSSTHNTGLTKLIDRVCKAAGELVPAQRHVSEDYPYDVRTCIDGFPCLIFYRGTIDGQPSLLGKYNFNNDKSTEDVFGFEGIPGYHDAAWVADVFGGENPTECWEFLNNDYPMGSFLDDDFGTVDDDGQPHWMKVFEARYPDDDDRNAGFEAGDQPTYLKALVQWVKSTNTAEAGLTLADITARQTKFRNELSNYFDVNYLCDYFMFTEVFGCVDQRVKNMMLAFWYNPDVDKMLAYMIFYDCDTILGLRNDGRLKYNWDLSHDTTDPELSTPDKTVYAFAGHDSVLWNNLRALFTTELAAAYTRIRAAMTNDFVFNVFDVEQSAQYVERVYNIDALNKYVSPKTLGVEVNQNGQVGTLMYSYLEAMQGSRKAHRRWWLTNRLSLFDARYMTGQYKNTDLTFKGNSAAGATVTATAARDFFFAFVREAAVLARAAVAAGDEWSYTYGQVANVGTIFHLYGGEYMSRIDLSGWGGFTDLNIPNLPRLEELILGKAGSTYTLTEIAIGTKLPMLRLLDVRNYTLLPSLDLSSCTRLEEVEAGGCASLSAIRFAEGCPLATFGIPANYQTLTLRSLPRITRAGLTFDNRQNLTGLWVENCPRLDGLALMKELLALSGNSLRYVRITGLALTGDGTDLLRWYDLGLGGFDVNGNTTTQCRLAGTYILTKYLDDATYGDLVARFDELDIRQPQYTMLESDDSVADDANMSNLDNSTGYRFGSAYVPSGHVARILAARHRCLGKQAEDGVMTVCRLHDDNSNFYADAASVASASPALLDSTEGDVFVHEPHYWYKGVNDYLNRKKYYCFSVRDGMPDTPEATIVTLGEIKAAGRFSQGRKMLAGNATVDGSVATDTAYSVCSVDVSGFSRARFPSVLGTAMAGAVFADGTGAVLASVIVPTANHGFNDGMYVVADIPPGATALWFSVLNNAEFDMVVLSNSDRIEDMEPGWVEHAACLVGVFDAHSVGSRIYSAINGAGSVGNLTWTELGNYAAARSMILRDYEAHKDTANLFLAKYGRRDSQGQCGTGNGGSDRIVDVEIAGIGMRDTVVQDGQTCYVVDTGLGPTYVQTIHTVCMGYVNIFGDKSELLGGVSVPNTPTGDRMKWLVEMPDGTSRKTLNNDQHQKWVSNVVNQKYMDIICAGLANGSATTYYCDYVAVSGSTYRVVRVYGVRNETTGGLFGFESSWDKISSKNVAVGARLAFRGQIVEADSVEAFKELVPIA
ncbi:MAG: head-tail adaptor protein [Mediterranea sp.]|jgi:hypothetical protein|nr:head-tail adaptor protein [Mediterranea sp.]